MNPSLTTLAEQKRIANQLIEFASDEQSIELAAYLDTVDSQIAMKADSYHYVLSELENDAYRLRQQAQGFAHAARTIEGLTERLKERIKSAMALMDTSIVEGDLYRFKLSPGAPKLVIDEFLLPEEYLTVETVKTINKDLIKEDLANKVEIPGVKLEPTIRLLPQIRKSL